MTSLRQSADLVVQRIRGKTPTQLAKIAARRARSTIFGPPLFSMYQELDKAHFDYDLRRLRGFARPIRGEPPNRSEPYIVCLGAAQTFGRFCDRPYPSLLADRLDTQVLNLGFGGAGPATFANRTILDWLNGAELVVAQVLSGRSAANSMFDNSISGGVVGIRIHDRKRMRFEAFLEDLIRTESEETIDQIIAETRADYVDRTAALLQSITAPTVLFWFSRRDVDYDVETGSLPGYLSTFPHLVDDAMMRGLRPLADAYVECVSAEGVPQRLWRADESIDGAGLDGGYLWNRYYPTPEMHAQAADALEPVCRRLLDRDHA